MLWIFFFPEIFTAYLWDRVNILGVLRRKITNNNEISSVFCLQTATLSRHDLLRFRCSWKPQDIIDFYTYHRTSRICMCVCVCVCRWTSVFCVHASVCLRREGLDVCVCHLLIGSSLGASKTTSPSAFPFQTDSTRPAIKRKENFYMAQAPRVPRRVCTRPS